MIKSLGFLSFGGAFFFSLFGWRLFFLLFLIFGFQQGFRSSFLGLNLEIFFFFNYPTNLGNLTHCRLFSLVTLFRQKRMFRQNTSSWHIRLQEAFVALSLRFFRKRCLWIIIFLTFTSLLSNRSSFGLWFLWVGPWFGFFYRFLFGFTWGVFLLSGFIFRVHRVWFGVIFFRNNFDFIGLFRFASLGCFISKSFIFWGNILRGVDLGIRFLSSLWLVFLVKFLLLLLRKGVILLNFLIFSVIFIIGLNRVIFIRLQPFRGILVFGIRKIR